MANLSAYIDFSARLNFSSNTVTVEGVSLAPLPGGVTQLTVTATVRQPDCVTGAMPVTVSSVSPLSFSGTRVLRLTTDKKPQKGTYKISVTIGAAGYDDTVIEKQFSLRYQKPVASITKNFNLLTPSLSLIDDTIYNVHGLIAPTKTRSWAITIDGVGDISIGNLQSADLKYGGNYYDAFYNAVLTTSLSYTSADYPFLTVEDQVTGDFSESVNTIPPYSDFPAMLTAIGELSGANMSVDCCTSDCQSPDYKAAYVLFKDIAQHICQAITPSLLTNITKFLRIYYKWAGAYENTNAIIAAYDLSFCSTAIGENDYIKNTTVEQAGANINISGSIRAGNVPHAVVEDVDRYVVSVGGVFQYLTAEELLTAIGGGSVGAHTHPISQVVGLEAALTGKVDGNAPITGDTKTKITYDSKGLVTSGDNLAESDVPNLPLSKIIGLVTALANKSDVGHTHAISEITGLIAALAAKADDAGVVHKAGNENITGVKVFTVSPIAPAPTNATHVVNKDYVDSIVSQARPFKITLTTNGTYAVPAGTVLRMLVITPNLNSNIKVGTTPSGDEIALEEFVGGLSDKVIFNPFACRASTTIYFTGITSPTEILIYTDSLTPINP
jgi:hypothetical protein